MKESCQIWLIRATHEFVMSQINNHSPRRCPVHDQVRMNETSHIRMSHVTYESVISNMNQSFQISTSHVTYAWVMSHMHESCHVCMSHVTYAWVMSRMHESCHICQMWMCHTWKTLTTILLSWSSRTHKWVMSHMNESCHIWMSHVTYEWVMSHMNTSWHIWMSHVTYEYVMSHTNESCHVWMSHVTYERIMSHMNESCDIWMSHVTDERFVSHQKKKSLTTTLPSWWSRTKRLNPLHTYMWHDSFMSIPDIPKYDVADSWVTWLIFEWHHAFDMTMNVWHDSFTCVTWRIYVNSWHIYIWCGWFMSDMTHFWMTSRICIRDMTMNVCHDSFTCVTWRIYVCGITHFYVWHGSFHILYSSNPLHKHTQT